jgi:RES domain-containing protein
MSCGDPALGAGRYHRTGEPGVWYASSREQGAWAELFRHFVDEGVDPFEVRRRVGRVSVDLQVLDLTDSKTRSHLGVDEADLVSDDCVTTQAIASAARDAGFDAVLAPAAALPGCESLAVFVHALPNVKAERSEVRQPPPRLADLLPLIRPHEDVPDTVRRLLITLGRIGAEAIRRSRR